MRNRNKYDWSKPFKFISSKEEFDSLQTNEENLVISAEEKQTKPEKKMNIRTPQIETVESVGVHKEFAIISPNYIRLPAHLNLPSANHYELTEVDHTFVKTYQDKFIFRNKRILTPEFLQQVIIEMELKAGKDMNLPRSKGWMMVFIEREYKDLLQYQQVQHFAEIVYNYWKNRREELKFPLLRLLWKPSSDQYNHMLAFRPREREKRSLRRANRIVQDEIIEELSEQFDLASKIVDRIQAREELKLKQTTVQISSFYNQCKAFCPPPDFIEELKLQDRVKDKEKIKAFHANLDNYKVKRTEINDILPPEPNNQIDQKSTIANFLSSVVYEAELLGITYEKMFGPAPPPEPPKPGDPKKSGGNTGTPSGTGVNGPFPPEPPAPVPANPEHYLKFSLEKYEDMLIRKFQEDENPFFHVKPCKDFLELKRRKVDRYYFGSDDEGEPKDVKKNVSTSFKKWQNLQHIPRTISATSDN